MFNVEHWYNKWNMYKCNAKQLMCWLKFFHLSFAVNGIAATTTLHSSRRIACTSTRSHSQVCVNRLFIHWTTCNDAYTLFSLGQKMAYQDIYFAKTYTLNSCTVMTLLKKLRASKNNSMCTTFYFCTFPSASACNVIFF